MIFHSSNRDSGHFVFARNATEARDEGVHGGEKDFPI
jgi:hypothetical protein